MGDGVTEAGALQTIRACYWTVQRPRLATLRPRPLTGDVRAGSVKRVAAAVGEGAQVVATLHAFLAAVHDRSTVMTPRE